MTDEEDDLFEPLTRRLARIQSWAALFDQSNTLGIRLPMEAAKQLMHIAEAIAECEAVLQTFAGRLDGSKEALQQVANHLRTIHQRLDDIILPATVEIGPVRRAR